VFDATLVIVQGVLPLTECWDVINTLPDYV